MPFSKLREFQTHEAAFFFLHCSRRPLAASPTLTVLSFCPPPISDPFLLTLFICPLPSPDTHPLQTEVKVQVLAASSETKVCFRDSASGNSYFRDSRRWCHCPPGVSIQSDTLRHSRTRLAGSLKRTGWGVESCGILSFSHSCSILSLSTDSKSWGDTGNKGAWYRWRHCGTAWAWCKVHKGVQGWRGTTGVKY